MMAAGAWGVGEVVFENLPSLIECGVPVQLNWTYVGNASTVFSNGETLYVTLGASVTVMVDVVSPRCQKHSGSKENKSNSKESRRKAKKRKTSSTHIRCCATAGAPRYASV